MYVFALSAVCLALIAVVVVADDADEMQMRRKQGVRRMRPKKGRHSFQAVTTTVTPSITYDLVQKLTQNYQREEPPRRDRPTEVRLGVYVMDFAYFSEQTMDYGISFYFRQAWRDPRLSFLPVNNNNKSEIRLRAGSWDKFWLPDTYFRNEKRASFHKVTVRNRLLRLNATGHMWYVIRITATLSCQMTLQKLPFDQQVCSILFESFGYQMEVVYFSWVPDPVEVEEGLDIPQFSLVGTELNDCSNNYTAGAFPCAEIRFKLRRNIGYYVIQVFAPSILTVIMSWVSFWINIESVPSRVNLGLFTVVTITFQSTSVNATLPRVSYIKAIDVYMIACLIFVFFGLLEYALVNVAIRTGVRIRTPIVRQASLRAALEHSDLISTPIRRRRSRNFLTLWWQSLRDRRLAAEIPYTSTVDVQASRRRARNIDRMSRRTFPLAFVVFNIIYWVAYTVPSSDSGDMSEEL